MSRLPQPGFDNGTWGSILNDFLQKEHNSDGSLKIRTDGSLSKSTVGLANVDDTSDESKPISSATQIALNAKANNAAVVHTTGDESVGGIKTFSDGITLGAGSNVVFNATTGTKIGTSVSQKIGFWNATPVVQPESTLDIRFLLYRLGLSAGDRNPFNPRIISVTTHGTPVPDVGVTDQFIITALAETATFAAPIGAAMDGQRLLIRIKDNGTVQGLFWNTVYRPIGVALPMATVASKTLYIGSVYNTTDGKWDVVAVSQES